MAADTESLAHGGALESTLFEAQATVFFDKAPEADAATQAHALADQAAEKITPPYGGFLPCRKLLTTADMTRINDYQVSAAARGVR